MSLYRRLRYQILRLRRLSGSPHSLALGCAVGVFMGIMPVLPFRTVLTFMIAIPSRANIIAAIVVGTVVANPFILLLWYSLALTFGNLLVANAVTWDRVNAMLDGVKGAAGIGESFTIMASVGWDMVFVLLAGGLIVALPAGAASYVVALRYFMRKKQ